MSEEQKDEAEEKTAETQEEENKKSQEQNIDYKAELEAKENELKQAKGKIAFLEKKNVPKEDDDDLEKRPDISETVARIVDEKVSGLRQEIIKPQAEVLARQVATSEDEAKLIMFHYENSIKSTGNLAEDISNAKALANKKRLEAKNSELVAALKAKESKGDGGGEAGQAPKVSSNRPKLSQDDEAIVSRMGAKWDGDRKLFVLPSGRTWSPNS
jgi:hypothetical protein